jgi:hypothetical protein
MGRKEKLLKRFLSMPKDFTYEEAVKLLNDFGFSQVKTGKTGGSRVRFLNEEYPEYPIKFHKPHPENRLNIYVLEIIKTNLIDCGLIDD